MGHGFWGFFWWYTFGIRLQAPWGFINNYPACDGFVDFVVLGVDARVVQYFCWLFFLIFLHPCSVVLQTLELLWLRNQDPSGVHALQRMTKALCGPHVPLHSKKMGSFWQEHGSNDREIRSSSQYSTVLLCPPTTYEANHVFCEDGFVPVFVHFDCTNIVIFTVGSIGETQHPGHETRQKCMGWSLESTVVLHRFARCSRRLSLWRVPDN